MVHTSKIEVLRLVSRFTAPLILQIALTLFAQMPQANPQHQTALATAAQQSAPSTQAILAEDPPVSVNLPLFLSPVMYDSGGYWPTSVAVGDLNGDGKPDLVVGNTCLTFVCVDFAGGIGVLLGNGDGKFQPPVIYSSGGEIATSVAIADLNGDHIPDVVVSNCGGTGAYGCQVGDAFVGVLLGKGNGTFSPVVVYDSGWSGSYSIVVADVNADGKPDLVVSNVGGSSGPDATIGILLGNGDGTFQPATTYQSGGSGILSPITVAVIDVNGDGKPDVIVDNYVAVGVLLGNGDGTFMPVVTYDSGGYYPSSIAVADLNGDGKADLVDFNACDSVGFLTPCTEGNIGVLLGNGDGSFQAAVTYPAGGNGGFGGTVVLADVNADDKTDVVLTNGYNVAVLLGSGDGILQAPVTYLPGGSSPGSIAVTDLNGDHAPDLVVTECAISGCGNGANVGVLLHVGSTATFTTLLSNANPSFFGKLVTFTASVTAGSETPVGVVTFFDSSTVLGSGTLANGSASFAISTLKAGSHTITAVYDGSVKFRPSESAALVQTVKQAIAPTATVLISSINPSVIGQNVSFTANVNSTGGVPPDGEFITFYKQANVLGTAWLRGGVATLTTSRLETAGIFAISALYGGDSNFASSLSPTLWQVVNTVSQSPTATALTSTSNPSIYGQSVTFAAFVTPSPGYTFPPTGKVKLYDGATLIGNAFLDASGFARITRRLLNAGYYSLVAVYVGDSNNGGSASAILSQVIKPTATSATVASSLNPSTPGQAVTFTARLTSPTVMPMGPVTFTLGQTTLGTSQLSGGKATFTTSSLPPGSNVVKVAYLGNSNIAQSSAVVTQVVQP